MVRRWWLAGLLSLFLTAGALRADPPVATYIFPAGGQRGQTVNVRVGGLFLHDRCSFEMAGPGVSTSQELKRTRAFWLEGPLLPLPDSQRQEDYPKDLAGQVKIAADAPLGQRPWRLWTAQGATPARRFVVGDLPEIVEEEIPGAAVPVAVKLPVTINGRIFPQEDVDDWSFHARKGQTVTCVVEAARLGSPLDSRLEVLGPDGRSLAENDDTFGADSFVRFTAPVDGVYRVRIHDINFRGGQAYVYRLTLTSDVYVDRAYPLGGRRGSRVALSLAGQGLPAGPVTVDLPANGSQQYAHRIEVSGKRSNPFLLELDDLPEVLKDDKGGIAGQKVTLPVVANGRILRPGETDRWLFSARKGETARFELKAGQLGSPLVAVLRIRDDKGKELARAEGAPQGKVDPALVFTAPTEGTYTAEVAGRFHSLAGPEYAYRLRMAREAATPDFRLRVATDALTLNRGGQAALQIQVERRGGFQEPITLVLDGLPGDVSASGTTVAARQTTATVILKAPATVKVRSFFLRVHGTAKVSGHAVTRVAQVGNLPGVDTVLVAVSVPTPFKVVGKYEMGWAARGSVGKRRYRIERNGFAGPLRISLGDRQARHLQGATGPTLIVPPGVSEFEYPVTLPPWMEIGRTCRVCVMATGVVKDADGSEHTVSFNSVQQNEQYVAVIEAGRLDVSVDRPSVRAVAGKSVAVPVSISRARNLEGAVRVELVVPAHIRGVTAEPVTIAAGQNKGVLTVRFASDRLGPFNMPLTVRATLKGKRSPLTAESNLEIGAP
jgi:pre-peptidase